MTKAEAAATLGVSVRSLERLVSEGRIKQGRGLLAGRRVATFDQQDVKTLRDSLDSGRKPRRSPEALPDAPSESVSVSFRLSRIHVEHLRREGAALGLSVGETARLHVVRAVEKSAGDDAAARETRRLREALAETFFNFLVLKCDTPKVEAKRFVRENLLGDDGA